MNSKEPITIEEILDTIMLKEAKPTHEALERWVARYPQHKAELVEFFATWAEQAVIPDETVIDEEKISSRLVSHALNLVYQQTAAAPVAVVGTEATRLSEIKTVRPSEDLVILKETNHGRQIECPLSKFGTRFERA